MQAEDLEGGVDLAELLDRPGAAQPVDHPSGDVGQAALGWEGQPVGGQRFQEPVRRVVAEIRDGGHPVSDAGHRLIGDDVHDRALRTIEANEQESWPSAELGGRYQRWHSPSARTRQATWAQYVDPAAPGEARRSAAP